LGTNSADLLFQILAIVRKLADELLQSTKEGPRKRLTVWAVYDRIKHSNSSLKRRSKKQLEDSIERALDVLKRDKLELDEDESLDGDFKGIVEEPKRPINKVWNSAFNNHPHHAEHSPRTTIS
jgi:ribosome biogenesis ATPase